MCTVLTTTLRHALGGVVALVCRPRLWVVVIGRNGRVVEFSTAHCNVSLVLEELRHGTPLIADANLTEMIMKVPNSRRVGAASGHERVARRSTEGVLDVGPGKGQAIRSEAIHVWSVRE